MTETCVALGTFGLMAPEQIARAKAVTGAADQWALAACVYEMLAGHAPGGSARSGTDLERERCSADDVRLADAVVNGRIEPLARARPDLPPRLCRAIDKALSYEPAARFPTVSAFAAALSRTKRGVHWHPELARTVGEPPRSIHVSVSRTPRSRHRLRSIVVATALAVAAASAGWAARAHYAAKPDNPEKHEDSHKFKHLNGPPTPQTATSTATEPTRDDARPLTSTNPEPSVATIETVIATTHRGERVQAIELTIDGVAAHSPATIARRPGQRVTIEIADPRFARTRHNLVIAEDGAPIVIELRRPPDQRIQPRPPTWRSYPR
jgi:serine/threonine protein kinase